MGKPIVRVSVSCTKPDCQIPEDDERLKTIDQRVPWYLSAYPPLMVHVAHGACFDMGATFDDVEVESTPRN